jgi:hypothetical protein
MGRMKSIQLGGIKNVWNFGSFSWTFLFTLTLSIFRWSLSCIYFMAVCQILWLCPGIHLSQFLIWSYTFVCLMYISMTFLHILEYCLFGKKVKPSTIIYSLSIFVCVLIISNSISQQVSKTIYPPYCKLYFRPF